MPAETSQLSDQEPGAALQAWAYRVIRWWDALAAGRPLLLIVAVWFLVAVPPALFRGYHYVEGLTATIAESALKDGHWLTPHIYNFRWIERPTLLSWIIAAISLPFGHVLPFVARLPTILAVLAGSLLVWRTLRPIAKAGAALVGAGAFLASPIVMRYYTTSVADVPLAVLLFATFLVWWTAFERGRIGTGEWGLIGGLLAIAALLKGPQPVAYVLLGLGAFMLLTRTWWQIPGLALAAAIAAMPVGAWYAYVFVQGDFNEWLRYTRLSSTQAQSPHPLGNAIKFLLEAFPAALLASGLLLARGNRPESAASKHFMLALACYAFTCTVVLLLWPALVNPRYILPMVPPLCVLAGIAYDRLSRRTAVLIASGVSSVVALLAYSIVHSTIEQWLRPQAYRTAIITGAKIAELMARDPAPVYRTLWSAGLNEMPYVRHDVTTIDPAAVRSLAKPAWIVAPEGEAGALIAAGNGHIKSSLTFDGAVLLRME